MREQLPVPSTSENTDLRNLRKSFIYLLPKGLSADTGGHGMDRRLVNDVFLKPPAGNGCRVGVPMGAIGQILLLAVVDVIDASQQLNEQGVSGIGVNYRLRITLHRHA